MIMRLGHPQHPHEASPNIIVQLDPQELEGRGGDHASAHLASKDRMEFHHSESGNEVVGPGFLEERVDEDRLRMARSLPGARYLVSTTVVREQWLKVGAELQRLFPEERVT